MIQCGVKQLQFTCVQVTYSGTNSDLLWMGLQIHQHGYCLLGWKIKYTDYYISSAVYEAFTYAFKYHLSCYLKVQPQNKKFRFWRDLYMHTNVTEQYA